MSHVALGEKSLPTPGLAQGVDRLIEHFYYTNMRALLELFIIIFFY